MIVVHTPKCGGTSLARSLLACGRSRVHLAYPNRIPMSVQFNLPPQSTVVHHRRHPEWIAPGKHIIVGHFHPDHFSRVCSTDDWSGALWVTLMREPIDRFLSLYLTWKYSDAPMKPVSARHAIKRGLGILEFASDPNFNGVLHRRYFGGVDMRRFDHIIWHDSYATDLTQLGQITGLDLRMEQRNVGHTREGYTDEKRAILSNPSLMDGLRSALRDEIAFYDSLRAAHTARSPATTHSSSAR